MCPETSAALNFLHAIYNFFTWSSHPFVIISSSMSKNAVWHSTTKGEIS